MKIGIIGTGKRFENIYFSLLKKLDCDIFLWNRTKERLKNFKDSRCQEVKEIEDLKQKQIDVCLCFLPVEKSYDIIGQIDFDFPVLLETPVVDQRWLSKKNVGVLEQWPFLPVEQLKELVYKSGKIQRPFWVFNDGRSFEYHAIAQLRKYCNQSEPSSIFGSFQNIENNKGFIDKNQNKVVGNESWTHGNVRLSCGAILMHSFTYNCKLTDLKPVQLLRAYSNDGSIISGRIYEMDNDYEMFEIRYCDKDRNVVIEKVQKIEEKNKVVEIGFPKAGIFWKNKYSHLDLNDQEIAIATLIEDASIGNIYSSKDGFIDYVTNVAMQQSAHQNQILKFN